MHSTLPDHDLARIADHAAQADRDGWLHPEQQALIHERGWLRMLAPRAVGGGEAALPDVVRLEEAIARVDGSMGWTVTLCAGAGWFAGFLPPDLARAILATPRMCLAGSGAPTGYADREGDGWRIDGQWDYASGAPMATHFTFNAMLREDGQPLLDAAGQPRVQAFVVPAALVEVVPRWRSMGLRATASHAYRMAAQWVARRPRLRDRPGARDARRGRCTVFRSCLRLRHAGGQRGRHGRALRRPGGECIAHRRNRFGGHGEALIEVPAVRALFDSTRASLDAARGRFYATLDAAWAQAAAGAPVERRRRRADAGAGDGMGGRVAPRGRYAVSRIAACMRRARTQRSTASGAISTRRRSMPC